MLTTERALCRLGVGGLLSLSLGVMACQAAKSADAMGAPPVGAATANPAPNTVASGPASASGTAGSSAPAPGQVPGARPGDPPAMTSTPNATPSTPGAAANTPSTSPAPAGDPPAAAPSPGSPEPDPSRGCAGGTLAPGRVSGTFMHMGQMRTFIQYVPASYDGTKPVPLLFDLHGGGSSADAAEGLSGFKPLADTEGYIWLAPNSMGALWSATDDTDELFLRALLTQVETQGCVDRKRVYSTGCSMGAGQTMWMACNAADIIAAVAPLCGTSLFNLETGCMPVRPISVMFSMGETDTLNCWDAGEGPNGMPCGKSLQASMTRLNECKGEIESTHNGVCETVGQCAEDTEVTICKVRAGHVLYQNPDMDIAKEHWAFLKRFYIR